MTERLLQFIWQFQYFNKTDLRTFAGELLYIFFPGRLNTNQGPDFFEARIKIGNATWVGSVELHMKTSDWNRHKHSSDANYSNVILHVVWENDLSVNYSGIPLLELSGRVARTLLDRYEQWMNSSFFIPCDQSILTVKDITWKSWKERLLAERLLRKSETVAKLLIQSAYHWEETFWWLLAANFGITNNTRVFEEIAQSVPLTILAKHKNQIHQLEALLLGQAGLLQKDFTEDYPALLKKEYLFLQAKYKLPKVHHAVYFFRMRPGNFPTVRLAQLAALVNNSSHLFSKIKEADSAKQVREWFSITANDYWHYHYRFDEMSVFKKKKIGYSMIDNIIVNTVVPVLFAYGNYHNDVKYKTKALQWLEETKAENNVITKGFMQTGVENKSAYDSQALIELKNEYCNKKKCLDCAVGNALLKKEGV